MIPVSGLQLKVYSCLVTWCLFPMDSGVRRD